jgi:hypothetical protein
MRYIFLVLIFFNTIKIKARINQIDHIYAVAPMPDKSFFFFRKELGLPVVWDRKVNGQYESSAVWLGNVSLEFVSGDSTKNAQFEGIGLEPLQSIKDILPVLDENKVPHDSSQSFKFKVTDKGNPEEVIGWTAMDVLNIFPPEIDFYIIDYNNKKRFDLNRSVANDSLENIKGGPLGVMFLKEIVIASGNFSTCKAVLNRIPGIKMSGDDLFSFNKGPSIKLVNYTNDATHSGDTGIIKIVIRVRSVNTAMRYLGSKKISGKSSKDSVYIDPAAVNGLLVELVDK